MKTRSVSWLSALFVLMLAMAVIPAAFAGKGKQCDTSTTSTATAYCSKCGDGYCAKQCGETAQSCPADCGGVESLKLACGKCGDGRCTAQCGETAASCPKDCGVESERSLVKAVR